jgi:hypothetical protein
LQRVASRHGEPSIGIMTRTLDCLCVALLCTLALVAISPTADAAKKKTIASELSKLAASGAIDEATYAADRAIYVDVKRRIKRLTGARKAQLAGALATVEGIAARGQMRASRLYPLFLTLQRNAEWWSAQPLLANGQRVTFSGSELVWQYVPGQGIQLHPLANFGKLNAYAKGSKRNNARNTVLLDELLSVAVPRGGGLAWEYYFSFDGGSPPWVSALAQGTGLQAIARSAAKLGRMPELLPKIQAGLSLFEQAPPTGVRVQTEDGVEYAQYSFWPSLQILNGFIQSLVGLYDYARISKDPEGAELFQNAEPEARAETPTYDTGAWSLYSRGSSTHESSLSYHDLLEDFLAGLCKRTKVAVYCTTAEHFVAYKSVPPILELQSKTLRGGKYGRVRFELSKISNVTLTITRAGRVVERRPFGAVGYGKRTFGWEVPRKRGTYDVQLAATDLAGNSTADATTVRVLKPKKKKRP